MVGMAKGYILKLLLIVVGLDRFCVVWDVRERQSEVALMCKRHCEGFLIILAGMSLQCLILPMGKFYLLGR